MSEDAAIAAPSIQVTSRSDRLQDCAEIVEASPCSQACPIGTNVKAYVSLIATGKFEEALEVARGPNPFPGICGRVCTHPCEQKCNRAERDDPVAIAWLKRFAADYELQRGKAKTEPAKIWRKEKVAVIGSGPAGLTAAKDLVLKGYPVTVFESMDTPGGMLVAGIPTFRLPRRIISLEIGAIEDLGVEIKTGVTFGKDVTYESLKADGYKAILLAVGAHKSLQLGVPGEELEGVDDCLNLLRRVNEGTHPGLSGKVAVIGGGSSAVDSARASVRLGASLVEIFYRRTKKEMPAAVTEVEEAEHEGVVMHLLVAPLEITGEKGKVKAMKLQRMELGEPGPDGRRRPVPIKGSEYTVEVDHVISSIGQQPDVSFAEDMKDLEISKWNTIVADKETLQSSVEGVFGAGDAVTGPWTVVDAIASGHRAAASMHSFLSGEEMILPAGMNAGVREFELKAPEGPSLPRKPIKKNEPKSLVGNYEEIELGYAERLAMEEAQRCLRCGPCFECKLCVQECEKEVMVLSAGDGRHPAVVVRVPADARTSLDGAHALLSTPDSEGNITEIEGALSSIVATVNEELCRGCGKCEEVCVYAAPRVTFNKERGAMISSVNEKECKGCGTCVAACPSGAMQQKGFTDAAIFQILRNHLVEEEGRAARRE